MQYFEVEIFWSKRRNWRSRKYVTPTTHHR